MCVWQGVGGWEGGSLTPEAGTEQMSGETPGKRFRLLVRLVSRSGSTNVQGNGVSQLRKEWDGQRRSQ